MGQYSRLLVSLAIIVALLAIVPAAVAGQSTAPADTNDSFPITLTDATDTEVSLDERPERVTTTNPSAAQVMWELDADSQVVGLTQFAHYLDGAENRQNVSSTELGVSVERVVDTEPDLVLAPNATSVETVETLRDAGLTVYHFPEATDFEDVKSKTQTIGRLTGNDQAARETNAWVDANVEAVSAATADAEEPRLMYPLLGGFSVGGDTFINEIIAASGAENVVANEFDGYQVVNTEAVIDLDPEVLLITDQTEGQILDSEPYSLTTAGQNNRSVFLEVNYINQPAPRSLVYSTRNLTAQLHPELYDESDFVSRSEAAATLDQPTTGTEATPDQAATNETETTPEQDDGTGVSAPGFGIAVTIVSLLGGSLLARRRSGA
ncbi:MAG: PGF-CTERM-anchored ABC transporter substrate-binding protein [Euryarchaeota archaeon]|nr:PGF-CTERM-anchored ABC transporter substrate-binding protein [Euryarchaeota archaeon]